MWDEYRIKFKFASMETLKVNFWKENNNSKMMSCCCFEARPTKVGYQTIFAGFWIFRVECETIRIKKMESIENKKGGLWKKEGQLPYQHQYYYFWGSAKHFQKWLLFSLSTLQLFTHFRVNWSCLFCGERITSENAARVCSCYLLALQHVT